jgi:uncharacterized membrane protein YcaP (DUF421 family)
MATLRWNPIAMLVKSAPTVLVKDGRVDREALRRHGLSQQDLEEGLRMEQVEDCKNVRLAMLEGGGKISVVKKSG